MSAAVSPPLDQPRVGGDPEALLDALDPEQRAVATALTGPVAVIAGAGTGKTRAITHRIAYGVATGAYNPTSVLAVTFTTRAAGELRGRLQQLGRPRGPGPDVPLGRAAPGAVLLAAGRTAASCPRCWTTGWRWWPRPPAGCGSRSTPPGCATWWARSPGPRSATSTPEDYPRVAAPPGRTVPRFDPETVARVFAAYERAKQDRGRIDFEDILLCAAALMSEHAEVRDQSGAPTATWWSTSTRTFSPLQEALLDPVAG